MDRRKYLTHLNVRYIFHEIFSQLHFVFEDCVVSCHQSMLVPLSPFLKNMLVSQRCCAEAGFDESVHIHLSGVKPKACQRLVDYLYTGTCSLRDPIKDFKGIVDLKRILQLDLSIEKKIFRRSEIEGVVASASNKTDNYSVFNSPEQNDVVFLVPS